MQEVQENRLPPLSHWSVNSSVASYNSCHSFFWSMLNKPSRPCSITTQSTVKSIFKHIRTELLQAWMSSWFTEQFVKFLQECNTIRMWTNSIWHTTTRSISMVSICITRRDSCHVHLRTCRNPALQEYLIHRSNIFSSTKLWVFQDRVERQVETCLYRLQAYRCRYVSFRRLSTSNGGSTRSSYSKS